jgi:hypothetical protein
MARSRASKQRSRADLRSGSTTEHQRCCLGVTSTAIHRDACCHEREEGSTYRDWLRWCGFGCPPVAGCSRIFMPCDLVATHDLHTGGRRYRRERDSNRRPPPYHSLRNGCRGLPPVADWAISAVFGPVPFVTCGHRFAPAGLHKCSTFLGRAAGGYMVPGRQRARAFAGPKGLRFAPCRHSQGRRRRGSSRRCSSTSMRENRSAGSSASGAECWRTIVAHDPASAGIGLRREA